MQRRWYSVDFASAVEGLEGCLLRSAEDLGRAKRCVDRGQDWEWSTYCSTKLWWMKDVLTDLLVQTGENNDRAVVDIGFGSGFVVAAFAAAGFRTYGIDREELPFSHAPEYFDRVQQELGRFRHQPVLSRLDISRDDIASFRFPDGKGLADMDVFYCNIGDYPDRSFHRVIPSLHGLKAGTVWCDPYVFFMPTGRIPDQLAGTPFTPVDGRYANSLLVVR